MEIRVWDYRKEYAVERGEILAAIEEVLESGTLILGSKVLAFEEGYAKYCGTDYGVGVANGTDAIFLALKALGVGAGDEVITVSNTAIPTVSAIVSSGATPVFVDIDERTYLMDTTKIESLVTERTKCILPVHLYGQCVDMDEVIRIARRGGLAVLEDCAQSQGAVYRGRKAGCLADISATSFYPTKILGTYGDGGMVNTSSEVIARKIRRLRFYGAEKSYYAIEHGYNSRLDELHAAILLRKLKRLDGYLARRRQLARQYNELLCGMDFVLPCEADYGRHAYYLYVVRHPHRDILLEKLRKCGIMLNISYPWPIHTMTGYSYLGYREGDLAVTESVAKEIFSLPMYPSLSDEEQLVVVEKLYEVSSGARV